MSFQTSAFFPQKLYDQITEVRVSKPELLNTAAERRSKPEDLTYDGKLTLLVADQPARRVTTAGSDPLAMGNRYEFLGRVVRVLGTEFDGIIATVDVIEELLILDQLVVEAGADSFLDDTLLIASVNHGGLQGSAWELNDRPSSFSADSIARLRLDGIKLTWRVDLQDKASGETLDDCAHVMEDADRATLPVFFEAVPVRRGAQGYETVATAGELVKLAGVVSALGSSSDNLWLVMPPGEDFQQVTRATTLPVLMMGDELPGEPAALLDAIAAGMKAGANARGVTIGRSVLFAANADDPAAVAHAIEALVHDGVDARAAASRLGEARGEEQDWLLKLFP
jgi:DhnA family fructose-bisphosphate aldolase class Ia